MIDQDRFKQFKIRGYRAEYMSGRVRTSIPLQIRALREQRGLNQTEYAKVTGKKQSVISRLENTEYGRVSVQTLLDIAAALDIALVVKYCTHEDFVGLMSAVSDEALFVEGFSDTRWEAARTNVVDEVASYSVGQLSIGLQDSLWGRKEQAAVSNISGQRTRRLKSLSEGKPTNIQRAGMQGRQAA